MSYTLNRLLLSIPILLLGCAPVLAQPTNTCIDLLAEAEAAYVDARFDRTIHLVDECLRSGGASHDELIAAYRRLALAYMRLDRLGDARLAVLHLITKIPDYEANPITDPPDYQVLVESVRSQFDGGRDPALEPSWFASNSRWLIGGGAALVAGLLTAIIMQTGSSGGDSSLPPPPEMPH